MADKNIYTIYKLVKFVLHRVHSRPFLSLSQHIDFCSRKVNFNFQIGRLILRNVTHIPIKIQLSMRNKSPLFEVKQTEIEIFLKTTTLRKPSLFFFTTRI